MTSDDFEKIVRRHFSSTLEMLERQISFISGLKNRNVYLYELVHVVESIDYWMSRKVHGEKFHAITHNILEFLEDETKHEIDFASLDLYWKSVKEQIDIFFCNPPDAVTEDWTNFDTVMVQIRHIQHHVGSINQRLSADGKSSVTWIGYCE